MVRGGERAHLVAVDAVECEEPFYLGLCVCVGMYEFVYVCVCVYLYVFMYVCGG